MPLQNISLPMVGGMDQSTLPLRSRAGFYDLLNFRPSPTVKGLYEQTPYFRAGTVVPQGTYWNGSAGVTESSTSKILLRAAGFSMSEYTFYNYATAAQIPAYYQTTAPAGETIYTGCRLVINSLSSLAITLGLTLDVEMTATATFRWRKNGGAWTTGLTPSTAGVSIDSGNATLYFLANTGFAGSETWAWQRTDYSAGSAYGANTLAPEITFYQGVAYFTAYDKRIMIMTVDSGANTYAISLGYRPVYGCSLTVFSGHLVVGMYSTTAGYVPLPAAAAVVGWSDKNDFHNFVPTDINEADSITLPYNIKDQTVGNNVTYHVLGLAVLRQQLYVVTTIGFFTTTDLGLPLVFSFGYNEFPQLALFTGTNTVYSTGAFVYIRGLAGLYKFDGSGFENILPPLEPTYAAGGLVAYKGRTQEVCFLSPSLKLLFVYQERTGFWYRRAVDFPRNPHSIHISAGGLITISGTHLTYYSEDYTYAFQPAYDTTSGTVYATPKITTQMIGDTLWNVKEISGCYLGATVPTGPSATYYSTAANLQFQIHWYASTDGRITGTPTTDSGAVWVNTNVDGMISLPRTSFRGLALEIQLVGLAATKPPMQALITAVEPVVYTTQGVEK